MAGVNARDVVNAKAVRQLLEQQLRATHRKPRMPVKLLRKDLEDIHVSTADLGSYDLVDGLDASAEKELF